MSDDLHHLVERGAGVYTTSIPFRLAGVPVGKRAFYAHSPDRERLIAFSPVPVSGKVASEIAALGAVTDVVLPTKFHDTYWKKICRQYPQARFHLVPGFPKTERPVNWRLLQENVADPLADVFAIHRLQGAPGINEHVFFHRESGILLVSDLLFHLPENAGGGMRLAGRLAGISKKPRPSRLYRLLIRDRNAFARSLDPVLKHSFETVLTSHFDIVRKDGHRILSQLQEEIRPSQG